MSSYLHALSSISVIIILIGFVMLLRKFGVLKREDGLLFSKLVVQVTLPVTIFLILSHAKNLEMDYFIISLYIFLGEIMALFLVWLIGRQLAISRRELGSLMLVSAFGSSALLGYVVVAQIFPSSMIALSEAVVISELGVGVGLFTIGTMVAIYFGENNSVEQTPWKSFLTFLKSPIFLSIVLGLSYSYLKLPIEEEGYKEFFKALSFISNANTFFVVLTVGVLLEFSNIMNILKFVFVVLLFKLILAPLFIYFVASSLTLEAWQLEVAVIESAMPSAMLSVVLSARYGCDAKLASKLVFITTLFSMITITLISGMH
jgi:hypothetical protein